MDSPFESITLTTCSRVVGDDRIDNDLCHYVAVGGVKSRVLPHTGLSSGLYRDSGLCIVAERAKQSIGQHCGQSNVHIVKANAEQSVGREGAQRRASVTWHGRDTGRTMDRQPQVAWNSPWSSPWRALPVVRTFWTKWTLPLGDFLEY